jgi:hypothetical protein
MNGLGAALDLAILEFQDRISDADQVGSRAATRAVTPPDATTACSRRMICLAVLESS